MTLPFSIGGARTVIPGVYDTFRVDDSLLSPSVTGRSVLLIGEAIEGAPGSELDLSLNFFTSYADVSAIYKSGPLVDAARQLFATQPSAVFNGAIDRLYIYKTNESQRASKALQGNYGSLVAARFGEAGNFIKAQVVDAQAQVLPSLTFHALPSSSTQTLKLAVNGKTSSVSFPALSLPSTGTPAALATALNAVTGLAATGGTARTIPTASGSVSLASPSAGVLSITLPSGSWDAGITAGDLAAIDTASELAGAGGENAGCYTVVSSVGPTLTLQRVSTLSGDAAAFDLSSATVATMANDIGIWSELTVSVTATPANGTAASLEWSQGGSLLAARQVYQPDALLAPLSVSGATVGQLSVTKLSSGVASFNLSGASWSRTPKAGDVLWVSDASATAGTAHKNVGAWVVTSASFNKVTAQKADGSDCENVGQVSLAGNTTPFQVQVNVVTTGVASARINSAAERQVQLLASRTSDGASFPQTAVGGRVAIELSYNDGVSTDCTVTIDQTGHMNIAWTGGPTAQKINLNKYKSLGDLVDFLNTIPSMSARFADLKMKSDPVSVLDMVTNLHIMSATATPSYTGRIKRDHSDFVALIDNNFSLLAFAAGTNPILCGLPASDDTAGFLTGGVVGATSNADIQSGIDAGLKVDVRLVVPTFSRDANKDIDDGLTDANSSYMIDAVHASLMAHVATASSTLFKRERFGMASHMGSFADSKAKAAAVAFERMQMAFQLCRATGSDGNLNWFQPWMLACALAAGRVQAEAGTPMLRKSFNTTQVKHIGDTSLFDPTLLLDFDPEDNGELTDAIESGLLVWKSNRGAGIQLWSPDLTTRSRVGDPQGWVWERASVLFACDEVREALRATLENLIGNSTVQTTAADVRRLADGALRSFITRGVLLDYKINSVTPQGNGYTCQVDLFPPEAVEFIGIDVVAKRQAG